MENNVEFNEPSKEIINEIDNNQSPKKYIRCPECGEEMLMVPTLDQMIEVIENHITSHKTHPINDGTLIHIKTPAIGLELTQQVLIQASDMTNYPFKPSL